MKISQPNYMIEFTPKTVAAVLSGAALKGETILVDVYDRTDATKKHEGSAQITGEKQETLVVTVKDNGNQDLCEWNYQLVRESADRAKVNLHRKRH